MYKNDKYASFKDLGLKYGKNTDAFCMTNCHYPQTLDSHACEIGHNHRIRGTTMPYDTPIDYDLYVQTKILHYGDFVEMGIEVDDSDNKFVLSFRKHTIVNSKDVSQSCLIATTQLKQGQKDDFEYVPFVVVLACNCDNDDSYSKYKLSITQ